MNGWEVDKRWSDRFLPEIKGHIGRVLISESPIEEDTERNTDLIVLTLRPYRIACRIRKYKFMKQYGDEFTIREGRPSGAKTELTKIIEGWGDYLFYGFADPTEIYLAQWLIGSLNAFRLWHSRELCKNKGHPPGKNKQNHDYSSNFHAFRYAEIPDFVVARGSSERDPIKNRAA